MYNNSCFSNHELSLISNYLSDMQKTTYTVYRRHNLLNLSYDINEDLITMRSLLVNNEFLVIRAETLEVKLKLIKSSSLMIFFIRNIYLYIFSRILPRLPIFSYFYSKKKKKNYALSRAEFIGRAIWSGFDVITDYELANLHHIIVRKSNTSYVEKKPSYYPIISLERVGLEGKIIYLHKIRTMHPYSEFIQDYILHKNGNTIDGKILNDYRITTTGLFLRKYWLDEIPQIIDVLRGKIGIVGVRALSTTYHNNLPDYIQRNRTLLKPGLLPPVYADKTTFTMQDIISSDLLYTERVINSRIPIVIKIQYIYKIVVNIIFHGSRSK